MTEAEQHPQSRAQVQRLTERLLTGTIGDEEFEYFESLLLTDSAARQAYIEHVNVHSQLSYLGEDMAALEEEFFADHSPREQRYSKRFWLATGALTCSLALGGLLLVHLMLQQFRGANAQALGAPVGVIISTDLKSEQLPARRSPAVTVGQVLAPQTGDYQFELSNGVACTLHGPAKLRFRSPFEVLLDQGTLVAHVPPEAVGFRVETPTAQFIDLGTTFSVSANAEGDSELRVFQGAVSARAKSDAGLEEHPLLVTATQILRISPAGIAEPAVTTPPSAEVTRGLRRLAGIRKIEGAIELLSSSPLSTQMGALESDAAIFLIPEQASVELAQPLTVVPPAPRTYTTPGEFQPLELPAGTRCTSFLLHCDFDKREQALTGTILFDRPILGLIFSSQALQSSDRLFARKGLKYPSDESVFQFGQSRGCVIPYAGKGEYEDTIILHPDGHGLTVTLNAPRGNMDQIRVLVQAPDS